MIIRTLLTVFFSLHIALANAVTESEVTNASGAVDQAAIEDILAADTATVKEIYDVLVAIEGETSESAIAVLYGALRDNGDTPEAAVTSLIAAIPAQAGTVTSTAISTDSTSAGEITTAALTAASSTQGADVATVQTAANTAASAQGQTVVAAVTTATTTFNTPPPSGNSPA